MVIKLSTPYDTNPPLLAAQRWKNQARIAESREASPVRRQQPETSKQIHITLRTVSSWSPTCDPRVTSHPSVGTRWLSRESSASATLRAVPHSREFQSVCK